MEGPVWGSPAGHGCRPGPLSAVEQRAGRVGFDHTMQQQAGVLLPRHALAAIGAAAPSLLTPSSSSPYWCRDVRRDAGRRREERRDDRGSSRDYRRDDRWVGCVGAEACCPGCSLAVCVVPRLSPAPEYPAASLRSALCPVVMVVVVLLLLVQAV